MDKTQYKVSSVYKDLGIAESESLEDSFTTARLSGNMVICGYMMADAIKEIIALDVSVERKLLIMGAMIQSGAQRVFDHECYIKLISTNPFS